MRRGEGPRETGEHPSPSAEEGAVLSLVWVLGLLPAFSLSFSLSKPMVTFCPWKLISKEAL